MDKLSLSCRKKEGGKEKKGRKYELIKEETSNRRETTSARKISLSCCPLVLYGKVPLRPERELVFALVAKILQDKYTSDLCQLGKKFKN